MLARLKEEKALKHSLNRNSVKEGSHTVSKLFGIHQVRGVIVCSYVCVFRGIRDCVYIVCVFRGGRECVFVHIVC